VNGMDLIDRTSQVDRCKLNSNCQVFRVCGAMWCGVHGGEVACVCVLLGSHFSCVDRISDAISLVDDRNEGLQSMYMDMYMYRYRP